MPIKNNLHWNDILFSTGDYRVRFFKIIDYYIGGLLCFLLQPKQKKIEFEKDKISKILIIRPGGIGDAVLLIPLIKEIKNVFWEVTLDILAEKRNREVFFLFGGLDRVFCYDNWGIFSLYKKLKENNYDIIFDTEQWHNLSAILSYLISDKIKIGFDTRKVRTRFYTYAVTYSQSDYEADSFINLLGPLLPEAITRKAGPASLVIPKEDISWAKMAVLGNNNVVSVSLSASIKERMWSSNNFQGLANYLIKKGYKVIFLGGMRERRLFDIIHKGIYKKDDIFDFVAKTNLSQTAALLSISRFYIGLDSGILHVAYAAGIPTISLFGPGIINKWAPRGIKHIAITSSLTCSPCTLFGYTLPCKDVKCMEAIKVEDVEAAVEKLEGVIR